MGMCFENEAEYVAVQLHLAAVRLQYYYNHAYLSETAGNRYYPDAAELYSIFTKRIPQTDFADMETDEDWQQLLLWEEDAAEREAVSAIESYALVRIAKRFALNSYAAAVLRFALLAAQNSDMRSVFGYFHGHTEQQYPTLELCTRLPCNGNQDPIAARQALLPMLPALQCLFPALAESDAVWQTPLSMDMRLCAFLLGEKAYHSQELSYFTPDMPFEPPDFCQSEIERLLDFYSVRGQAGIYFCGEKGSGKQALWRWFCQKIGQSGFLLDFQTLKNPQKHRLAYRMALRDAVIQDAVLAVTGLEALEAESFSLHDMMQLAQKQSVLLCVFAEQNLPASEAACFFPIQMPTCNEVQRYALWQKYSANDTFTPEVSLTEIANTFLFPAGQIQQALSAARLASGSHPISRDVLYHACYDTVDHKLSQKAKRVQPVFGWEDLKLPTEEKTILRDLCNRVKNKHIVLSQWGYDRLLPYGSGVSAVFAGPPGTGKTMAAQVVAGELHMELYQIDLSQVVDKYIGETEKNIRLIFDEARKSNAILFFDEADALFGKRVEAKDSNDRSANIESSMLLQCMEQYSGISILATNHYSAMDTAFVRRFKYLVNFHLPTAPLRLAIWKAMFPPCVPLSETADLEWLAQHFELSGAFIKNIAVSAAFYAAEEQTEIDMVHLLRGLKREMLKEGRKLDSSQMGTYAYLMGML